ncbi:hypothetical protein ACFLU8_02100 [Chloroflexota bacterium]
MRFYDMFCHEISKWDEMKRKIGHRLRLKIQGWGLRNKQVVD